MILILLLISTPTGLSCNRAPFKEAVPGRLFVPSTLIIEERNYTLKTSHFVAGISIQ